MPVTWNKENKTPAAAITFVAGGPDPNRNTQTETPILFCNHPLNPSYCENETYDLKIDPDNHWVIKSVDVRVMTDWLISTASITLVPSNPNNKLLPRLPTVYDLRGGTKPTLSVEDEIRIYLGWRNGTELISKDLLTEVPFPIEDTFNQSINNKYGLDYDPNKKLSPVFWGFIDKLEIKDFGKGPQLIISCRDRMRVLADTRLLSLPDNYEANDDGELVKVQEDLGERDVLIYQMINAVNYLGQGTDPAWRNFRKGLLAKFQLTVIEEETNEPQNIRKFISTEFLGLDSFTDHSLWNRAAAFMPPEKDFAPRVHIWVERGSLSQGAEKSPMQVLNKTPIEIIDHLALQEELPIDFRISQFNGDFIFGPRSIDFTGFEDQYRNYRSYFYRVNPPGKKPCPQQQCIRIESVTTSMGTFNQFILMDNTSNGREIALNKQIQLTTRIDPPNTANRTIIPPNRTQIIADGSLSSYPNPYQGAAFVALNAAKRFSRDSEGIEIEVLGDPTFYLNEAITVYNTGLHDYDSVSLDNNKAYIKYLRDIRTQITTQIEVIEEELEKSDDSIELSNSDTFNEIASKTVDTSDDDNPLELTDIDKDKFPIYRVVNIAHSLNELNFTTSVIGITDY